MGANTEFVVHALPGQDDVEEVEKKYVAAIASDYRPSSFGLEFNVEEPKTVATLLRSLLV